MTANSENPENPEKVIPAVAAVSVVPKYDPSNPGSAHFARHFMEQIINLSPEAQCKAMEFIGENRRMDERARLHAAWAQLQAEVGQVEAKGEREGGIKYPRWQDVHDAIHPCLTRLGMVVSFERISFSPIATKDNKPILDGTETLYGFAKYCMTLRFIDGAECIQFYTEGPVVRGKGQKIQDGFGGSFSRAKREAMMMLGNVRLQDAETMSGKQSAADLMSGHDNFTAAFEKVFGVPFDTKGQSKMVMIFRMNAVVIHDKDYEVPQGKTDKKQKEEFAARFDKLVDEVCDSPENAEQFCAAIKLPMPSVYKRVNSSWTDEDIAKLAKVHNPLEVVIWALKLHGEAAA